MARAAGDAVTAVANRVAPAPEQAVVLVGGLGTRLGHLPEGRPKPLVEVGGRPFLSYLLHAAGRFGFRRALLLAGYRADRVLADAPGLAPDGLQVEVCVEPEPLGTGGALRHALGRLDARFLLLNGDSLFDFNWLDLVPAPEGGPDGGADAVLALRAAPDASRFGVVELEGARVTGFRERGDAGGGFINGGVYLLTREAAHACPERGSLERDVLPALAAAGRVRGRRESGFFLDIGVPKALSAAQTSVPASLARPAVFFDRDGVLNVDTGYTHRLEDLRWTPGAIEAVKAVNDAGWFAFVVTNQAGVARGLYGEADVHAFHAAMQAQLRARGAHVDAFAHCPHHPEGTVSAYARACDRRKPAPGMVLDLARTWPVDLARSLLVGDRASDLEAAAAAGIAGVRYAGGDLAGLVRSRLPPQESV